MLMYSSKKEKLNCAWISELPPEEDPTYIQIMMSVPYNLNSYNAYLAVGVDTMYLNSTGLFDHLYYYSGPFERAPAGSLVEFTPEGGKGMLLIAKPMHTWNS